MTEPKWTSSQWSEIEAGRESLRVEFQPLSQAVAALSCILSLMILLTGYWWYKDMVKSKIYMKLIMMISLCDFIACSWMSLGYPPNNAICDMQGVANMFFFRGAWMWCAAVATTAFFHLNFGSLPKYGKFRHISLFIWSLNLILELLPFAFGSSYGGCDKGTTWGHLVVPRNAGAHVDDLIVTTLYSAPLIGSMLVCIVLPLYLQLVTIPRVWAKGKSASYDRVCAMVRHVFLYPVCLALFWGPNLLYMYIAIPMQIETVQEKLDVERNFCYTAWWCYLFGTFCSLLFLWKSAETRERWTLLLRNAFCGGGGKDQQKNNLSEQKGTSKDEPVMTAAVTDIDNALKDIDFLSDNDYALEYDTRYMDEFTREASIDVYGPLSNNQMRLSGRISAGSQHASSISAAGGNSRPPSNVGLGIGDIDQGQDDIL